MREIGALCRQLGVPTQTMPGLHELLNGAVSVNHLRQVQTLLHAAQAVGVERFVMISADKAVNPTSVMGASKRVAELLVHQAARQSSCAYQNE